MEVKDAITLMLLFGMFILTLLAYMKKNRPPRQVTVYPYHYTQAADCS